MSAVSAGVLLAPSSLGATTLLPWVGKGPMVMSSVSPLGTTTLLPRFGKGLMAMSSASVIVR